MPALITSEEAMAMLRVSRNTFWKWKRRGYVTPANLNPLLEHQHRLLFKREDIQRILKEGLQPQDKAS